MTNVSSNTVFVNSVTTTFAPEYNYDTNPVFSEVGKVAKGEEWAPGESGIIVQSNSYQIKAHPPVRSFSNLSIMYDVTFSEKIK